MKNPTSSSTLDPLRYRDTVQIFQGTDDGRPAIISRKVALLPPDGEFSYIVVAVGSGKVRVSVDGLPDGLVYSGDGPKFDVRSEEGKPEQTATTGRITGRLAGRTEQTFAITASNEKGSVTEKVTIRPHRCPAPTPPMGWLSWEWYRMDVSQEKMMRTIDGLYKAGLQKHGWKYVIIDDGWQQVLGTRTPGQPIRPNEKFPDMKKLSDHARKKGFILGIYTTPWSRSYGGLAGSGHYEALDVKQFAEWNIGYLKLDYRPWEVKQLSLWQDLLRSSGKDIVLAFSNNGLVDGGQEFLADIADVWRTGSDIGPTWQSLQMSVYTQYLDREGWKYLRKGHWPDPDMLQIGKLREGQELPHNLQHFQMSIWAILPAPLLLSCDAAGFDDFHLSLLTNDEVIAVNQDPLGLPAKPVSGDPKILYKPLADGTTALGFFNPTDADIELSAPLEAIGRSGPQPIRDLWERKSLGEVRGNYTVKLAPFTARLFKVGVRS